MRSTDAYSTQRRIVGGRGGARHGKTREKINEMYFKPPERKKLNVTRQRFNSRKVRDGDGDGGNGYDAVRSTLTGLRRCRGRRPRRRRSSRRSPLVRHARSGAGRRHFVIRTRPRMCCRRDLREFAENPILRDNNDVSSSYGDERGARWLVRIDHPVTPCYT